MDWPAGNDGSNSSWSWSGAVAGLMGFRTGRLNEPEASTRGGERSGGRLGFRCGKVLEDIISLFRHTDWRGMENQLVYMVK